MDIREKMRFGIQDLMAHGPITIVALGDSVTHGCVGFGDEMDYETVYWNRLRKKLLAVCDQIPINVINAGIGGDTTQGALARLDRQVLIHQPDLVTVCYGLNDVNLPLAQFGTSLREIFRRLTAAGTEVIYMTPNMLNTYVADDVEERWRDYAAVTADFQNNGRMDASMAEARAAAAECGVPVCDCYAKWKQLSLTEDTTMMLANRINHPTREMHELFARSLFEMIIPENLAKGKGADGGMYAGARG